MQVHIEDILSSVWATEVGKGLGVEGVDVKRLHEIRKRLRVRNV